MPPYPKIFAYTSIRMVAVNKNQVQRLAESSRRGRRLASLTADPNRFLAAVQVGVTLAGFVSAGFGAAQIAPELAQPLISAGLAEGVAQTLAFVAITVLIAGKRNARGPDRVHRHPLPPLSRHR